MMNVTPLETRAGTRHEPNSEPLPIQEKTAAINHAAASTSSGDPTEIRKRRGSDVSQWQRWIERAPAVATRGGGGGGRVLLISYQFPPTGGSGVQRPAKLVKYLHRQGWEVEVLTAGHDRFPWTDPSLTRDIPPSCRIHRIPGKEPACLAARLTNTLGALARHADRLRAYTGSWMPSFDPAGDWRRWIEDRIYWRLAQLAARAGLGNGEPLWIRPAVQAAIRLHRQRPFDAVVSTGPPHFVHRVAMSFRAQTGIPWVAETRDPLVSDYDRVQPDPQQIAAMRRLERTIMRQATKVITTSRALARDLRRRYPGRRPADIVAITNGFDREDLQDAALGAGSHTGGIRKGADCVFIAAGAFYGRRELTRLVAPLRDVLDRRPAWRKRVRLVVAGRLDGEQERHWRSACPPWMELVGYQNHATVLRWILQADCSVLMLPDCRHARLCIPGKVFELLALPTHVLALVPPGSETEAIVRRAGATTYTAMEDRVRVADALESIIGACLKGRLAWRRQWTCLDRYDRGRLAAEFGRHLNDVLKACRD